MAPSSFIPFCEFGGNSSTMGLKIDQFYVPVCKSFQAKIVNDQLCYEVDLSKFSNRDNIEQELKSGFVFIMDYNEDRQITIDSDDVPDSFTEDSLTDKIVKSNDYQHSFIYLNTIGRRLTLYLTIFFTLNLESMKFIGEGQYNLNTLKTIEVTESYLGLGQDVIQCQNVETIQNCTTRQYTESLQHKCGCLPITMTLSNKVDIST